MGTGATVGTRGGTAAPGAARPGPLGAAVGRRDSYTGGGVRSIVSAVYGAIDSLGDRNGR
jgi:hypothetical protein